MTQPTRESRQEALRRCQLLFHNARDIVLFIRPDGRIVEANRAAVAEYGYTYEELLRMRVHDLRPDDTQQEIPAQMEAARTQGITFETVHRRKDGTTFPVEVSACASVLNGEPILLSTVRNITARRRVERVRELLREIDHLILQRKPVSTLVQTICDRLAEVFGYTLVWVGRKEADGRVSVLAHAGVAAGFLEGIDVRWDESPAAMGPTGTAIRTARTQLMDLRGERSRHWHDRVRRFDLRQGLSIPLAAEGTTLGALSLYTVDERAFDEDIIAHLETFANQVAISLLAARDQEQLRLRTVALEEAANAVVMTDRSGTILWVNPAWSRLTGYSAEEAVGQNPRILKSGSHPPQFYRRLWETILAGKTWQGELYNRRKDGTIYVEEQTITPVRDAAGRITHFIAIKQDITERKRAEEHLRYLAMHDPVTNLLNRRALSEALERVCARTEARGALLLLDMDNFKLVNDTLGHVAGDNLLVYVSHQLRRMLRPAALLARWGGDEFAALLEEVTPEEAAAIAEQLREAVRESRFHQEMAGLPLSISVGIAPIDGTRSPEQVLNMADFALYTAKEEGKNRVVVYQEESERGAEVAQIRRWAVHIREALLQNRLLLQFRPVVRLQTGEPAYHEATVRLRLPDGQVVLPREFIPAAERLGMVPAIDRWVADRALELLDRQPDLRLVISLSGLSLSDESLLSYVEGRLQKRPDLATRLGFQITETAAVRDMRTAREWMRRVSELGCQFILRHFGSGYCSLTYLKAIPLHCVTIAGAVVERLPEDRTDFALVKALTEAAHALGAGVVAEAVDAPEVADLLREIGVEYAQGALFGEPAAAPQPSPVRRKAAGSR